MRIPFKMLLPFIFLLPAPAGAAVAVTFQEPDRYTDIGDYGWERDANVKELERYVLGLGAKYLSPQQNLRIEVLDVDLAGWPRWGGRAPQQVRVLTGRADWPIIRLRYTLESPGKPAESREETVSDSGYLQHGLRTNANESLHYEKRMLEAWFKGRFAAAR
jgi:DUF3016 family protein